MEAREALTSSWGPPECPGRSYEARPRQGPRAPVVWSSSTTAAAAAAATGPSLPPVNWTDDRAERITAAVPGIEGNFTIAVHQPCIFIFSDDCFECKQRERLKNCRAILENLEAFSPFDGWPPGPNEEGSAAGGGASGEMINLIDSHV